MLIFLNVKFGKHLEHEFALCLNLSVLNRKFWDVYYCSFIKRLIGLCFYF